MELILVEAFIFMIIPLIIACRGKERKTSFCVVVCIFNHVIMWFLFCLIMLFNYGVAYNPGSISYVFFFLNYTLLKNGHRWFKNNPSAQLPPPIVPVPDVPSKLPDSSTHREEASSVKAQCDIVVLLLRDYSFPIDSLSEKLPALQRCLNTLYRSPKWE